MLSLCQGRGWDSAGGVKRGLSSARCRGPPAQVGRAFPRWAFQPSCGAVLKSRMIGLPGQIFPGLSRKVAARPCGGLRLFWGSGFSSSLSVTAESAGGKPQSCNTARDRRQPPTKRWYVQPPDPAGLSPRSADSIFWPAMIRSCIAIPSVDPKTWRARGKKREQPAIASVTARKRD